jgi:HD-like signal output (HDOD) protein
LSAAAAPDAGHQLGPYRVVAEIGEGGMGRVFRGEHTLIGRAVAIKLLNAEVASDPTVRARFFMEARIVNEIRHPNIVEVTDFGVVGDQPYIVMEYLHGRTLSARIAAAGALPEETAIAIARQIASALGAVHERGIVHRDLKTDNVFLSDHRDYPDFVKILDFGIAKPRNDASDRLRTQTGTVVGTPAYMSPEQCMGDVTVDLRTDVYSLGVVLFQMVTGRLPFEAEGIGRIMVAHLQDPPPPSGASPRLEAIVQRALAKQPADRFSSMHELREALEAALPARAQRPPPAATLSSRPAAAAAAIDPAARTVADAPWRRPAATVAAPPAGPTLIEACAQQLAELELPAPSPLQASLLSLSLSPAFSFPAALELVRRDARLGQTVGRMANLEPYAGRVPIGSPAQAISRVGALGLVLAVVEQLAKPLTEPGSGRAAALLRSPWRHALGTAYLARRLAAGGAVRDEPVYAYLVGLLLDLGRPLAAEALDRLERRADPQRGPRRAPAGDAAMLEAIGANHERLAARLAQSWSLPAPVRDALAVESTGASGDRLRLLARLAAAMADAEGLFVRKEDAERAPALIESCRTTLRIDETSVRDARQRVREWVSART